MQVWAAIPYTRAYGRIGSAGHTQITRLMLALDFKKRNPAAQNRRRNEAALTALEPIRLCCDCQTTCAQAEAGVRVSMFRPRFR